MKTPLPQGFWPVAALRPTDTDLDSDWTAERQTTVLDRIETAIALEGNGAVAARWGGVTSGPITTARRSPVNEGVTAVRAAPAVTPPAPHRVPRRRAVLITSGAAAVVALLAVPLLVPSGSPAGPPSASALEALANVAAGQQPLVPDQYMHTVYEEKVNGYVTGMEVWAAADGQVWRKDTAGRTAMYYTLIPAQGAGGDSVDLLSSQDFLMSLPTDPDALSDYLRSHVHGSNSQDEAVFSAVREMLLDGLPQPALRAAALRVLENTPHVTAKSGPDSLGRRAIVVTFDDQSTRPDETQSLYFDPDTAAFLGVRWTSPGLDSTTTATSAGIVDSLPAEVHRYADHYTDIGTCVTDRGVQTPDVCMRAQLGSR